MSAVALTILIILNPLLLVEPRLWAITPVLNRTSGALEDRKGWILVPRIVLIGRGDDYTLLRQGKTVVEVTPSMLSHV